MRLLAVAPRGLTRLALIAAAAGIIAPSAALAGHSDLLLAGLVLVTALGIPSSELSVVRHNAAHVAVLSTAPVILLGAAAWALAQAFHGGTADGLLAVGLSSSEVAAVGLVALAQADAPIALAAVTGSLITASLLGPLLIGVLAGQASHAGSWHLLARFALVVIVPLIAGVAIRTASRAGRVLQRLDPEREGVAALIVVVLVYGALSGASGVHGLGAAILASVVFLVISSAAAELWRRRVTPGPAAVPGALTIAMRDFAVAAALASQAFGPRAAAVPGVYGVLMLIAGAIAAPRFAQGS